MGPCRRGHEPHACYRGPGGHFFHAHGIPWWTTPVTSSEIDLKAELDQLKKERSYLEQRIQSLEDHLKEK
jgi:hypothetical protein